MPRAAAALGLEFIDARWRRAAPRCSLSVPGQTRTLPAAPPQAEPTSMIEPASSETCERGNRGLIIVVDMAPPLRRRLPSRASGGRRPLPQESNHRAHGQPRHAGRVGDVRPDGPAPIRSTVSVSPVEPASDHVDVGHHGHVLVFEVVAVHHVAATEAREPDQHLHDLEGAEVDGVLPAGVAGRRDLPRCV